MIDVPNSVLIAANKAYADRESLMFETSGFSDDVIECIAAAIMTERARCAEKVRFYRSRSRWSEAIAKAIEKEPMNG